MTTDFIGMDSLLQNEEILLRQSISRWVEQRILPEIGRWFYEGQFPLALVPEMASLGLFGIDLPEQYGCAGGSAVDYGVAMMALEYGDSGVRSFASVQSSLVMYPIFRYGDEAQRRKYLPALAAGRMVGCFGLTEPDHGSDPGSMKTRAVKDGTHWVLNGSKMWITNGTIADVAVVWAQTPDGIRGFLVERGTPGFSAPEIGRKMSLRASITSELVLEDVRVPDAQVLPSAMGLGAPLSCLTKARFGIGWGAVGVMAACFDAARRYAQERVQFSRPIAAFQLTQNKLADMLTELSKAQLLALQVGRLMAQGKATFAQVSMLKRNNVYWALECARIARSIHGANGITTDYAPIRHALNMESVFTYEGTHEMHTLIIGREITGLSAFE